MTFKSSLMYRYGLAVLAVLAATGLRLGLNPVLGAHAPYLPFALAVMFAARFGGRAPGLVAAALSTFCVIWFFLEPVHTLVISDPAARWGLALAVVTTVLIALFVGDLHESFLRTARAEEALRRQAELIDLSHDAVITTDSWRRIVTWNKGAELMYGWPESEAAGKVTHELLQTVGPVSTAEIDAILRCERQWDGELHHVARDGHTLVVDSRQVLIRDRNDRPAGILEINRDITDRKQAEEALRESEARSRTLADQEFARAAELQATMDALPVAMFISRDPECRNMTGNCRAYELFRMPPGSNLSKSAPEAERLSALRVMKHRKEIPAHELPMQKAAATGQAVHDFEFELLFEDGTWRDMVGDAVPLLDAAGRSRGAVGVFADVTERRQAEERLRQMQKLESIGLLAGGVAHDFNNLLTVIMGGASSLLLEHPEYPQLNDVISASERAGHLTKQLLAYAGKGQFVVSTFDLNDLVPRCAQLLSAFIPKRTNLVFNLSRQELPIEADPSQIEQSLVNLVINATEAIPPQADGRIGVSTRACEVPPAKAQLHSRTFDIQPGRFVCLEITDNGAGMDQATLSQIFDPFFSTKFTGRGLGLAAVHGIVRSLRGFIEVLSAPGKGSTFLLHIPTAGKQVPAKSPAPAEAAASRQDRGHGIILVVDDEELVRKLASATLRRQGYDVLEARDGKEALQVLASAAEMPLLALVDLAMPVLGGDELVPVLNREYPGMKIVVTSGYPEEDARKGFAAESVAAFLQKPYTVSRLTDRVNEALAARVA